jgi:hypothetical protein
MMKTQERVLTDGGRPICAQNGMELRGKSEEMREGKELGGRRGMSWDIIPVG